MKNFLRALRYAWPHRRRLFLSVACAMAAAVFWSLNFTAIYPVLKLLSTEQSPQEWVTSRIEARKTEIAKLEKEADVYAREREKVEKGWGPGEDKFKAEEQWIKKQQQVDSKLETARRNLRYLTVASRYIYRFAPTRSFDALVWVMILVVIGIAIKGIFEFLHETLVGNVVNLSLFDLRNRFYRKAVHLDVDQFNDQGTSEMMARFTNDMEVLGTAKKTLFGKVIAEPLKVLCCVIVACFISWRLTMMFLILVPIALLVLSKIAKTLKRATHRLLERMSSIYKILDESFKGIRVVKAFTMEPYERSRFSKATRDYYHKSMLVVKLNALAGPVVEVLGAAAMAAALLAGAYLVINQETHIYKMRMSSQTLEAAELIQLYALLVAIADPVRKLSSVYTRLQSGFAASDRVFHFMDREPQISANTDGPRLERHTKSIEFRDVCFSYVKGQPILTNVHLDIKGGETVAIVGRNGCGKSTLVGLLPRFYDPDHGAILVDGVDIRTVNLRSLRAQIGVVTQREILFDDTIENNIRYGNRRASQEQIEAAAKGSFADEFVRDLPKGYDTELGEAASRISGGQRQRLALARAMLRDPSILILDEFNSQYDPESEAKIHRALIEFRKGRTTLIITHRLKTLEIADRIVVLDGGRIAAVGTHTELLEGCPLYQRLHTASEERLVA